MVEENPGRNRDVQGTRPGSHRDRDRPAAASQPVAFNALVLVTEHEREPVGPVVRLERRSLGIGHGGPELDVKIGHEPGGEHVQAVRDDHRQPERRAHGDPQDAPRQRVGAAWPGQDRINSENVANPRNRPEVLGIADPGTDHQGGSPAR